MLCYEAAYLSLFHSTSIAPIEYKEKNMLFKVYISFQIYSRVMQMVEYSAKRLEHKFESMISLHL